MDGNGMEQVGHFSGASFGPTLVGYHQSIGIGKYRKANYKRVFHRMFGW